MRLRWFHTIAGAAALALAAFVALSGPSSAIAAKAKPAAPHGKVASPPAAPLPIIGPIDTQATHAMILEAETGAVLLERGPRSGCRRPRCPR
jgi:D-alanyl-D-alanine carboxypeptidase